VRLIALDLDGTLMRRDHTVSEANAAAVHDAVAAGIHIVLATSRWYLLAKRTADLLGIRSPIICNNGAMVRDPADGARLLELLIPAPAAIEIASIADEQRSSRW
jgi:HAD superfamily hydrolase (TIGR01484 family)